MGIEVIRPGMFTTVQDLGRAGHAAEGFPECGACDKRTLAAANALVGNAPGAAALEFTILGPELRARKDCAVAVCGMGLAPKTNGKETEVWKPLFLRAGDVLNVGALARGCRGYIAVRGGVRVPAVMGSRSTDTRCGIGGVEGRALRAGDFLPVEACAEGEWERLARRARALGRLAPLAWERAAEPVVSLLPGPQDDLFPPEALETLTAAPYTVAVDSNRMGLRLEGAPVRAKAGMDILSDGILEGSVQISSGGGPIVMLADHQTTGGYAKIATVAPADIPILAQLRPGERVRFRVVDRREALRDLRRLHRTLRLWTARFKEE